MAKKYISKYTGPEIDSGLDNIPKLEGKLTELESKSGYVAFKEGYFIHYVTGSIEPLSNSNYIECAVSKGMVVAYKYQRTQSDLRGLVFYDIDGNYIIGYQAISTEQTIIVPENAVLCRASVKQESDLFVYGYNVAIEDLNQKVDTVTTDLSTSIEDLNQKVDRINARSEGVLYEGQYVSFDTGEIFALASANYVELPVSDGMKIDYSYVRSTKDGRGLAFYDKNGAFILGYQTKEAPQVIDVPSEAVICKASVKYETDVSVFCYNVAIEDLNQKVDTSIEDLNQIKSKKENVNLLGAFNKIICIGDSLTFSSVFVSQNENRRAYQTYPMVLQKLTGTTTETYATPGASAKSCYNEYASQISKEETNALAIIYLGTNLGLFNTIDTDVQGDNPDMWAENQTGAYCRFVDKLLKLGYKVLLLKIWTTSGEGEKDLANSQAAIINIAERFNVAVMDVPLTKEPIFHYYPDKSGKNNVHYNDLGYAWFADALIKGIGNLDETMMSRLLVK